MNSKVRKIQEIVYFPITDQACDINEIAAFIDSEIALDRVGKDGDPIIVDSVSIVDADTHLKFPFAHSGEEFRNFIKSLHCIKA